MSPAPGSPAVPFPAVRYGRKGVVTVQVAEATTAHHHRLGALNDGNSFLTLRDAGSPRSRCLLILFPGQHPQPSLQTILYENINLLMRAPPSRPYCTLTTSQRPHVQTPSRWELEFQHMNSRGTQSVHGGKTRHSKDF